MNDACPLLHNMSVPPKTVVTYAGLGALAGKGAHAPGPNGAPPCPDGTFGAPVLFELDDDFRADTPRAVVRQLGVRPGRNAEAQLEALLDARAAELPLPDGCVAIEPDEGHPRPWRDPLTVLAVLTKCSGTVWLRAKQPALAAALERRRVTLVVPPRFVDRLPEVAP
jgi:hypothetical protein